MSSISRIGSQGGVSRDTPSQGFDALEKREKLEARRNQEPPRNAKVDEVAKLYEKQFLREMVKAMRGTVGFANEPSMAENIYRDQLDSEYVESWGDNGGIGLSTLIYDQIMDRYFNTDSGRSLKKQGPVALTDKDISRVSKVPTQEAATNGQVPLKIEVKPQGSPGSAPGGPVQIQAPWDSTVISKTRVEGRTAVTLEHGPGLRSTVIFDGVGAAGLEPGNQIKKGSTLGTLSPEAQSFFWNLKETGRG